jgi:hypothetical protein
VSINSGARAICPVGWTTDDPVQLTLPDDGFPPFIIGERMLEEDGDNDVFDEETEVGATISHSEG